MALTIDPHQRMSFSEGETILLAIKQKGPSKYIEKKIEKKRYDGYDFTDGTFLVINTSSQLSQLYDDNKMLSISEIKRKQPSNKTRKTTGGKRRKTKRSNHLRNIRFKYG